MKKILLSTAALAAFTLASNAQAFIPNSGFESWGTTAGEDQQPTGWISYNIFTFSLFETSGPNPTSVTQAGTPDNYAGNYSAKITTVSLVSNPDAATIPNTAGVLFTGAVAFTSPYMFPGYASQQRPASMTYYAKYTPVAGDSAFCLVSVTHWNGSSRDTIAWGYDGMTAAISAYQQRNVAMIYNPSFATTIPDTISILFSASSPLTPQAGSALWVDEVAFTGYVGMEDHSQNNGVFVYPNPSSSVTEFDVTTDNAFQVIVYDMMGREVVRENFNGRVARVNSAELADGSYTYTIIGTENEVQSRGQFGVAH